MNSAVLGGGAWGTALALHLARLGHDVRLFVRDADLAAQINERRRNEPYLPGVALEPGLLAEADAGHAVRAAQGVFVAIPSAFCRGVYRSLRGRLREGAVLVSATKGLDVDTLQRMSQVAAEELPGQPLAVLSGPSFALEVARGQPTAVVVASADHAAARRVQEAVSSRCFRAYTSEDVVGVELAGALKNVIAIAAGIVDGLGCGLNTGAALITRGLAEISRLALAEGGRPESLAGLAGLGDLVLTCTGALSRNRSLGQALGRGASLAQAQAGTRSVAEGVRTTLAACALAERAGVEMPIALQMREVLYAAKTPGEAVDELMSRTLKRE